MSESAKLRLVRCPKCENLLPELPDYSVYQCGGCGTVLRAKTRNQEEDSLSEKSDEERVGELSKTTAENGTVHFNDTSDADFKLSACLLHSDKVKDAGKCENQSNVTGDKWDVQNGPHLNMDKDDSNTSLGTEQVDLNIQSNSETFGSGRELGCQKEETVKMDGIEKNSRNNMENVRFSTSKYEENRSNYPSSFISGVGELLRNHSSADGADKVKNLEEDRLELLRKLDELKNQLSQSCNLFDNQNQNGQADGRVKPPRSYSYTGAWSMDGSSGSNNAPKQLLGHDKFVAGPSYSNYCPEPFPFTNGVEMPMPSYYSSMHNPNNASHLGDQFGSHMLRRNSYQFPYAHQHPPHQYPSGHYVDPGSDLFNHCPHNPPFHLPSCSCFNCQNRCSQVPAPAPGAYYNRRYQDMPNNPSLYCHESAAAHGACGNNTRTPNPSFNFRDRQPHSRWPSEFNSEVGGFVGNRPRRTALVSGSRHCYPVAGGAPFLTCYNCFVMLEIPKKLLMAKNQQSVRCGACSTVIGFAIINKKLVISDHSQIDRFPSEVDDSDDLMVRSNISNFNSGVNHTSANFSSDDYDNTGYDFESLDREPVLQPIGSVLSSTKQQEMQSFHPSSLSTSEDENSPDVSMAPRDATNNLQHLIQTTRSPPLPGSPLQSYFDYSANNHAANRFSKGNKSSRSDQENVKPNKVTSRQNSLKEASLATEMDVSMNDYSNTSHDVSREDDQPKANKGGESFFTNIIKKSFRSNQADERSKSNVSVNGHLLPYRAVKKAEKFAGPIHSGKYWYDARAGFWGIMGGPCVGIIPPYIEEFDYPLPEKCAGGNTGVFVNGRELHQKDLDLLAGRGLPTSRDRSYIIEISGRVLDEDTGEELEGLGKLAPTVEKAKHGFGMKVPRAAC